MESDFARSAKFAFTDSNSSMISTVVTQTDKKQLSVAQRLMLFFAAAYVSQGLSCAQFGVIAQPIQFFMMKGLNLTAAQISSYLAIMMIPWVVKPFYQNLRITLNMKILKMPQMDALPLRECLHLRIRY